MNEVNVNLTSASVSSHKNAHDSFVSLNCSGVHEVGTSLQTGCLAASEIIPPLNQKQCTHSDKLGFGHRYLLYMQIGDNQGQRNVLERFCTSLRTN